MRSEGIDSGSADDVDKQVGLAPPDGSGGARPTFSIDGVDVLVMDLLAA